VLGPVHVVFCILMLNKEFSYEALHSVVFLWMCHAAFWFYMLCGVFLIETVGRSILEEIPLDVWKTPCDLSDINTHMCACAHNASSTNSRKFDFVSQYKCKCTEEEKIMAFNLRAVAQIERKFIMFCIMLWHLRLSIKGTCKWKLDS